MGNTIVEPATWADAFTTSQAILRSARTEADLAEKISNNLITGGQQRLLGLRVDLGEAGTAPFSPREDFWRGLPLDILLAFIPFDRVVRRVLSRATRLTRRYSVPKSAPVTPQLWTPSTKLWTPSGELDISAPETKNMVANVDKLLREQGEAAASTALSGIVKKAIKDSGDDPTRFGPTSDLASDLFDGARDSATLLWTIERRKIDELDGALAALKEYEAGHLDILRGILWDLTGSFPRSPEENPDPAEVAREAQEDSQADQDIRVVGANSSQLSDYALIKPGVQVVLGALGDPGLGFDRILALVGLALTYPNWVEVQEKDFGHYVDGQIVFDKHSETVFIPLSHDAWAQVFASFGHPKAPSRAQTQRFARGMAEVRKACLRHGTQ